VDIGSALHLHRLLSLLNKISKSLAEERRFLGEESLKLRTEGSKLQSEYQ
jgi:hypothetical protein